jgi:hypothetical protein
MIAMNIYTYTGSVDKLRMITFERTPLLRFTLCFKKKTLNCLLHTHALTFLAEVAEGAKITVSGYFNARGQFVVKKHKLHSKSLLVNEFEHSLYPKQKTP